MSKLFFVPSLAGDAARGVRHCQQARQANVCTALATCAVICLIHAFLRGLDLSELFHLSLHQGDILIDQHVGERSVTRIGHFTGQIGVVLMAGTLQFKTDFCDQFGTARG